MQGSIFVLLKRFVESNFDHSTWLKLLHQANITRASYDLNQVYPDEEMFGIITQASLLTGLTKDDLYIKFGEYLVPDLLLVYNKYIDPNWQTLDMLEHTETTMHAAVRSQNQQSSPPLLHVNRVNEHLIVIDYFSKRKMGGLAVGIIKGIAAYYNETDLITITPTSALDAERVQIKVEKTEPELPGPAEAADAK